MKKVKFLDGYKENFDTLISAVKAEDVCLMHCKDKATGKDVAVVCAVNRVQDGSVEMVPFAKLFDGNPYDELLSAVEF